MRVMISERGNKFKVIEHIILKNFWEYYVLENEFEEDKDLGYAYVMGFENEFGYFTYNEITPYIMSRTSDLTDIMPAQGFEWEDK